MPSQALSSEMHRKPVLLPAEGAIVPSHARTVRNGMSMSDCRLMRWPAFVANNARRVLGVDAAQVLPVSARAALDAKLASTKDKRGFFGEQLHVLAWTQLRTKYAPANACMSMPDYVLHNVSWLQGLHKAHCTRRHELSVDSAGGEAMPVLDEQGLARNEHWQRSRFGKLEQFMVDFLVGGASAGESLRLKLQTPLFVSDALLEAARQQLEAERAAAEQVTCEELCLLCLDLVSQSEHEPPHTHVPHYWGCQSKGSCNP